MQVREFEEAVFRVEEVLIRVRAPANEDVEPYDFERQASQNMSITRWSNGRLLPRLGGLEVAIIDGNFQSPHGRTKMGNLRASYER